MSSTWPRSCPICRCRYAAAPWLRWASTAISPSSGSLRPYVRPTARASIRPLPTSRRIASTRFSTAPTALLPSLHPTQARPSPPVHTRGCCATSRCRPTTIWARLPSAGAGSFTPPASAPSVMATASAASRCTSLSTVAPSPSLPASTSPPSMSGRRGCPTGSTTATAA